ncbi:MAG TPA: SMP-30/gluconolactonase/LRE family protein [Parafilimonas sp.]|nr:SMP-30/gluconolactonase/LRE family protein [Parafilimonas sp.]
MYTGYRIVSFILLLFFVCCNAPAQSIEHNSILAPGAKLTLIDSNFSFTEGPATDKGGNIFFTDQPNDNIWKYDINGKLSLFMHGARRSNGMYFDAQGNLISCADKDNELIAISPGKKITVLIKDYEGHVLNGPNDVWIDRSGGMYITDPYYQRDYWTRKKPDSALGGEKVYYLPFNKKELIRVDSATIKPNGIVGTPDGKYLYVADMGDWKTYRYDINKNGTLSNKKLFADEASDGMTIDERGNIYFTNKGVTVYNPSGEKIEHIDVPEPWTANICFGGKERNILFITASKSVYIIEMSVKGVE